MTDERNARENLRDSLSMDRSPGESEKESLERRALVWALLAVNTTLQELHSLIDQNISNFGRSP